MNIKEQSKKSSKMDEKIPSTQSQKQESGNVEEIIGGNSNYSVVKVENTPFNIVGDGQSYKGVIGLKVVTKDYNTQEEVMAVINEKGWELIQAVIFADIELYVEHQKRQEEAKNSKN